MWTLKFRNDDTWDVITVERSAVPYEDWNEYGTDLYSCHDYRMAWNDEEEMLDWFAEKNYFLMTD